MLAYMPVTAALLNVGPETRGWLLHRIPSMLHAHGALLLQSMLHANHMQLSSMKPCHALADRMQTTVGASASLACWNRAHISISVPAENTKGTCNRSRDASRDASNASEAQCMRAGWRDNNLRIPA